MYFIFDDLMIILILFLTIWFFSAYLISIKTKFSVFPFFKFFLLQLLEFHRKSSGHAHTKSKHSEFEMHSSLDSHISLNGVLGSNYFIKINFFILTYFIKLSLLTHCIHCHTNKNWLCSYISNSRIPNSRWNHKWTCRCHTWSHIWEVLYDIKRVYVNWETNHRFFFTFFKIIKPEFPVCRSYSGYYIHQWV